MANFADKFNDPRWAEKRASVLARADYKCDACDEERYLDAHICYWEKDREPWDYPDEAYRCYCAAHMRERRLVERDIRVLLAAFSIDELDSLHLAVKALAGIPSVNRGPRVERLYVAAKKVRDDYDSTQNETTNEDVD
ncbi:MAG: hypothetical protein AABN33_19315 [Acidobacteriota bacterium]